MNKPLFYFLFFVLLLASCQREQDLDGAPDIRAEVEAEQKTRTSLSVDESGAGTIYWNPSDQIDVFFGTKKAQYTSQNAFDAIAATFKTSDSVSGSDVSSTNIWGLYPSNSSSSCNGSSITTTLPSTQYGVPNTFDKDIFPAVARSSSTDLQFYNVCGGIKFNLAYDDIKKITFRGNNNEDLAGTVSISFVDNLPKATIVNGVKEITLTPKTGTTFTKGADYYFILLPVTLSAGFTITFTTTDGTTGTLNYTDNPVTIKRSIFGKKGNMDVYAAFADERQPNNVIYYTSIDGQVITPTNANVFGANIVSNEYVGGRGIIAFEGSVLEIGENAFCFCDLTSIKIPNSVTIIGRDAFRYCSELVSIEIPNSVKSIGHYAFAGCTDLTSIEIPSSVESIGSCVFYACTGLTSLEIPDSVTSIGINLFAYCSSLATVCVDNSNSSYDSRNNCNAIINTTTNELISGCTNSIIPNSVTSIGDYAFEGFTSLASIEIPNSVIRIGSGAFQNCGLTSIEIPNSVTDIGDNPFRGCHQLASIIVKNGNPGFDSRNDCNAVIDSNTNELVSGCMNSVIPKSVTGIGLAAFGGCIGLTSIEIPSSVTTIGYDAFSDCRGLTSIKVKAMSPPTIGPRVFHDTNSCPIYVPAQSVDSYKTSDGWSEYADRINAMGESYEVVDLGLPSGVKWATCNVGADTPEGYGDYFAWGETEPKSNYDWSTYKWCNGSENTLTKYCNNSSYGYNGFTDNKTVLDPEDDAARANWGGSWRMPTFAEWNELRTQCVWTWTTLGGKNGYNVRGPNGNTIFLPAAGRRYGTSLYFAGSYGNSWSSSLRPDGPNYALSVLFNSSLVRMDYSYRRYWGLSVRPVSE